MAFAVGLAGDCDRGFEHVERALSINPNCVRGIPGEGLAADVQRPARRGAGGVPVRHAHRSRAARWTWCREATSSSRTTSNAITRMRSPPRRVWSADRPDHPLALSMAGRRARPARPDRLKPASVLRQGDRRRAGRVRSVCATARRPGCSRPTTTTCWRACARPGGRADVDGLRDRRIGLIRTAAGSAEADRRRLCRHGRLQPPDRAG